MSPRDASDPDGNDPEPERTDLTPEHLRLVDELVADCIDRFNLGEDIDADRLVAEHPDIALEVLEQLQAFLEIDADGSGALVGRRLGEFRLLRQLGRGGNGIVYEATQESLDRSVALKVLPGGAAADGTTLRRFLREARAAALLQHDNIVTVYGMGIAAGTPYYSMEYVEGETLARLLARLRAGDAQRGESAIEVEEGLRTMLAALPARAEELEGTPNEPGPATTSTALDSLSTRYSREIARAFAGVARGLHHAHEQGIVHRDLKPSNLILDGRGRLRVLDFGLAKLEGQVSITRGSSCIGTPLYMSPEQASGDGAVDARSDVYSLGATLYEVLAWRPPHEAASVRELLEIVATREPADLPSHVPADLATIVLKCLRRSPDERYASAAHLAADLERFASGRSIAARPEPRSRRWARRVGRSTRSGRFAPLAVALVIVAAARRCRPGSVSGPAPVTRSSVGRRGRTRRSTCRATVERSCSSTGRSPGLAVRDMETGDVRTVVGKVRYDDPPWIEGASLSNDGRRAACLWLAEKHQRDYGVRIIDLESSAEVATFDGLPVGNLFGWTPDDRSLLVLLGTDDPAVTELAFLSVDDRPGRVETIRRGDRVESALRVTGMAGGSP